PRGCIPLIDSSAPDGFRGHCFYVVVHRPSPPDVTRVPGCPVLLKSITTPVQLSLNPSPLMGFPRSRATPPRHHVRRSARHHVRAGETTWEPDRPAPARGLFGMFAIALHRTQYYLGLLQTWGKIHLAYTTHTLHPVRLNCPPTTRTHSPREIRKNR